MKPQSGLHPGSGRPRVLLNCASSIDGKLHVTPRLRADGFTMSRHPEDHRRMRALRGRVDAVIAGANNVRVDDPDLAVSADERMRRRNAGIAEPLRVVITRRGDGLRPDMKMFDKALGGEPIVAHAAAMPPEARARLSAHATLVELGGAETDALLLLEWLATERGCRVVLCEGGGIVNAAFFAARAVDEIHLTLTPRILGGADAPTLVDGAGFAADAIPDPVLAGLERIGDELFLRYELRW